MKDRCPTCGEPVETVTSDEGTSHYESVAAKRIGELEAVLRDLIRRVDRKIDGTFTYAAGSPTDHLIASVNRAHTALKIAPSESEGER